MLFSYPWRGPRDISLPETSEEERMAGNMGKSWHGGSKFLRLCCKERSSPFAELASEVEIKAKTNMLC